MTTIEEQLGTLTASINKLASAAGVRQSQLDLAAATVVSKVDTANSLLTAVQDAQTKAESARDLAAKYAGTAGSGPATGLIYTAAAKSLTTAADVVAVHLYDTRQDSDGGAWTERCRGTSWYNEALNTTTRGATRRFPRVALIIARSSSVTIYDAHDLDTGGVTLDTGGVPRMWMVFTTNSTATQALYAGGDVAITSVFALNGRLWVTSNSAGIGGLTEINFVADRSFVRRDVDVLFNDCRALIHRNTTLNNGGSLARLVDDACHAVHARVIPGGPVDSAGLPTPTVAVATASGASVIHPNGAVYDIAGAGVMNVAITADGRIAMGLGPGGTVYRLYGMPYADTNVSLYWHSYEVASIPALPGINERRRHAWVSPSLVGVSNASMGLALLSPDMINQANGMVAYATTSYATGWMPGDIRGAWLCDNATGNITGYTVLDTDLSSPTGWTLSNVTHNPTNGTLDWTGNVSAAADYTLTGLVAGQTYLIEVALSAATAGGLYVEVPLFTSLGSRSSAGPLLASFTATSSSQVLRLTAGNSFAGSVTSVRVRLAVPDRSYKGRGLTVNGALNWANLPCGLASVNGFSASNFLEQPYTPDLDFETGDFCFAFWFTTLTAGHFFDRWSGTGPRIRAFVSSGKLSLGVEGTGSSAFPVTTSDIVDGIPRMAVMVRRGAALEVWLNGVREAVADASAIGSVSNTTAVLRLGVGQNSLTPLATGSLALFRAAAYAPTPAQIRRMYDDERALVIGGTAATFGGTSNNVTALATNETDGTLAVGTSDGVSIFAGLGRVQYLDGASGAAIGNDAITALSASGSHLLVATTTNAGLISDAVIARDRLPSLGTSRMAPIQDHQVIEVHGLTTDATPTDLSPRIHVGERESVALDVTVNARTYGANSSQGGLYRRLARYVRDAGGNVVLAGPIQAIGADQETTVGMDATLQLDTAAQTVTPRVTGVAGTRIVWTARITITRIAEDQTYAA